MTKKERDVLLDHHTAGSLLMIGICFFLAPVLVNPEILLFILPVVAFHLDFRSKINKLKRG